MKKIKINHFNFCILIYTLIILTSCKSTKTIDLSSVDISKTDWDNKIANIEKTEKSLISFFQENLELSNLIKIGYKKNKDLLLASAKIEQSRAQLDIIKAKKLPLFNASYDVNRQTSNNSITTSSAGLGKSSRLNLNVNWEIDLWGKIEDQIKSQKIDLESKEYTYEFAKISLAAQIMKLYTNIIYWSKKTYLMDQIHLSEVRLLKSFEERYEKGLLDTNALFSQRNVVNDLKNNVNRLVKNGEVSLQNLKTLIGDYSDFNYIADYNLPEIPNEIPGNLPSETLKDRPDIVSAKKSLLSSSKYLDSAKKSFFPIISLTSSTGYASSELTGITNSGNKIWNFGAIINQPIFNQGEIKAKVNQAETNYQIALYTYQKVILNAFKEVELALSNELFLKDEIKICRENISRSRKNYELMLSNYEKGNTNFTKLIESSKNLLYLDIKELEIKTNRLLNRIDLYLALGIKFV